MDWTSILSTKFAASESVIAFLENASLIETWNYKERILAIVQCDTSIALFVILSTSYKPKSFIDLSIETAIPIDSEFKCELDNITGSFLHLIISFKKTKLCFKLNLNTKTNTFVDILFKSINDLNNFENFDWLDKYRCKSLQLFIDRDSIAKGIEPMHKDNLIDYHMKCEEDKYTFLHPFHIFVGTWNVNGKSASISLKEWLTCNTTAPDIYVIGFQELDLSKETFLFDSASKEIEWYNALIRGIDSRYIYKKISIVRLVGMMLIILIKIEHIDSIKNISIDTVGTGVMGIMGNKGGVGIRFDLHNTSFCFINSHLAANTEECERRNQDYNEIYSRMKFNVMNQVKCIKDHDQIFWLGDLNYRIDLLDNFQVKKLLKVSNIEAVLKVDQLRIQHFNNRVLQGFREGPITFQPTYKYNVGTDDWDSSEKERTPAWCDRIFWKGDLIEQLTYISHPELKISDHKPVSAIFKSKVKMINMEKYKDVYKSIVKRMDKLENEFLPCVTVEPTEITFETVRYLELKVQEISIANTGQVPVRFEFINKLEDSAYCKEWLKIEPFPRELKPGEKCDVQLKLLVNEKTAFILNQEVKIYDILILHLDGGKDVFITVTGDFEKSSFGSSIEMLINLKTPICDIFRTDLPTLKCNNSYKIPKEIWFLVDHIYKFGLKQANLFKTPGVHSELLKIRHWLDYGLTSDIPGNVHSVVEALMLFLKSIEEPIIPYDQHYTCLNVTYNYLLCKKIVMELPECRKNVFLYICAFLQEVLNYSKDNGTDVKSLSLLFGLIFFKDSSRNKSKIVCRNISVENKKKACFVEHFINMTYTYGDFL